jgi:hypothetical protein
MIETVVGAAVVRAFRFSVNREKLRERPGSFLSRLADVLVWIGLGVDIERRDPQELTYNARVAQVTEIMKASATEAQQLLTEMESATRERLASVELLEQSLKELEDREKTASERLRILQEVEPEAAAELARLVDQSLDKREKVSSKRDYIIFGLGVIVTAITFGLGIWVAA